MEIAKNTLKSILGSSVIMASGVFAQGAGGEVATSQSIEDWSSRNSLLLESITENLSENTGFNPSLVWTGEVWSDVSRGSNIETMFDSLFTLGLEWDLSVIAKTEGVGRLGISAFYFNRTDDGSLGKLASSQGDFSNILAGDMARVFEIYYANDFATRLGDIGFRIGQLAADEDFMGMDYSDVLLNSSFGAIPNVAPAQLFSQYAVATLGLVLYYSLEDFDATFGLYNGNVGEDISSNNGFDYSNVFDSVAFWYQLGYNYKLGELSGRVIIGGNYHSSPDKVNFDALHTGDFYSFYIGIQQDILTDCDENAVLGSFARIGFIPDSNSSDNNFYADFGLNWFAPIPSRENDVLAVGVSIIENERAARQEFAHYETTLEATYKMQITPAIIFQPDMQIFFNPASNGGNTQTVYVVGARVEVVF